MNKNEVPAIQKAETGVEGFDEISQGGLPKGRTTLVMGGPGSGKTVFALQFLINGAQNSKEPGIFVAFEENSAQLFANAATFNWDLPTLSKKKVFFLDVHLGPDVVTTGDFEITAILAGLSAKAKEIGAKRIVFDGIDILLTLLNNPVAERREIYRLQQWLLESGLTGVITAKVESGDPFAIQRYSFLQFMADSVVIFHHRLENRVALRGLRIAKYRGSAHSSNEFALVIGPNGMEVAGHNSSQLVHQAPAERVPSGVDRLDTMLGRGYYRASCILLSGAPGTGKTTLSGAFTEAACKRGERCLFVSFDESSEAIVRNLTSVGINLGRFVKSGLLRIHAIRTEAYSAEEHFSAMKRLIQEHKPLCFVIDPISSLIKAGGLISATEVSLRLIDFCKSQGITVMSTALFASKDGLEEGSDSAVSTLADTWIHLTYITRGGERNRAITIVKSRGSAHSNQLRELVLSSAGVSITDTYSAGGEVLMGTARYEKEEEDRTEEVIRLATLKRKRLEHEAAQADMKARLGVMQRELVALQAELGVLNTAEKSRLLRGTQRGTEIGRLRSTDASANASAAPAKKVKRGGKPSRDR